MIAIRPEAGSSGMPPTPSCPKVESLERCPKAHQAPTSTHAPCPASQALSSELRGLLSSTLG